MKRSEDFTLKQRYNKMKKRRKKPVKKGNLRFFFLNFGKIVLEVTKLSFGSLVLGTIIKGDIPQSTILMAGIIVSGVGAILGNILITFFREE
jgi:hypothetical protein